MDVKKIRVGKDLLHQRYGIVNAKKIFPDCNGVVITPVTDIGRHICREDNGAETVLVGADILKPLTAEALSAWRP